MLRSTAQGIIVAISRLLCGVLAFITPLLLEAGPQVLYTLLSATVASGLLIGWICFHSKQRNEFNSEAEVLIKDTTPEYPASAVKQI